MTGLKDENFDADDLKFMAEGEGARKTAAGELVLVKIKSHQGLMEAAKQGRKDLLTDAEANRLIALMNDEKAPTSVRMMIAYRCGAVSFSYPLILILQLCRHETPAGQFVVTGKERQDKKGRPVLVIDSILPAPDARPAASKPAEPPPMPKSPAAAEGAKPWQTDPVAFARLYFGDNLEKRASGGQAVNPPDAVQKQIIGSRVIWSGVVSPNPTIGKENETVIAVPFSKSGGMILVQVTPEQVKELSRGTRVQFSCTLFLSLGVIAANGYPMIVVAGEDFKLTKEPMSK
jgi:hypothetical protein